MPTQRQVIHTDRVHDWDLPYSQAVRFGNLVWTAGQLADDPTTGKLVEGGIKEQTRQVLENVKAILEAAGTSLEMVVKTTCFLMDRDDFDQFNEIYREYFPRDQPGRSTFQVVRLAPGYIVEIEVVAGIPDA